MDVVVAHDDGSEIALIPVSVICNPVVDVGFMYIVGLDDEDSGLLLDGDCVVVAFVGDGDGEETASVVVGFAVGEIVVGATVVVIGVGAGVASIASPIGCAVGVPVVNDTTVGVPVVGAPVVENGLSVVGEFVVGETVGLLVVTVTTVGANVLLAIGAAVVTEEDGDTVGASVEIVDGGGGATAVSATVGLGVGTSIIEVLRNVGGSDVVTLVVDGDGELVSCAIMMFPSLKVHNIKTSMKKR